MHAIETLTDDSESLKRLVLERDAEFALRATQLAQHAQELAAARGELLLTTTLIEKLKVQIARLRRVQFGRSSEQMGDRLVQLELIVEDLETSVAQSAPAPARTASKTPPVRRPLPEHLPRETVTHAPAEGCPQRGGSLRTIGEGVAEMLEAVPASFTVIRHVRPRRGRPGAARGRAGEQVRRSLAAVSSGRHLRTQRGGA